MAAPGIFSHPTRYPRSPTGRQVTAPVLGFLKAEEGPTAVEYAVLLALSVGICFIARMASGSSAQVTFGEVAASVASMTGS